MVQTNQVKQTATLSSLALDAGLQMLLLYMVKWFGDGVAQILQDSVQMEQDAHLLDVYLEVVRAILDNKTLLVEPYVSILIKHFQYYASTHSTDLSAAAYPSQWAVSSSNLCTLHTVLC
jgi:hypothetical protein